MAKMNNPGRGRSPLVASTALGLSLTILAFSAPGAALASDECGAAPGGGLIVCPKGDYPDGISYDAGFNDLSIVVPDGSTLEGGVTLHGMADLAAFLTGVHITTIADGQAGVSLNSVNGDIIVAAQDISTAGDQAAGISAISQYGAVEVTSGVKGLNGEITTQGTLSDGVFASGGGDVTVASVNIHTFGDGSEGIHAVSAGGMVTIDSSEIDTHGAAATGIVAHGATGVSIVSGDITTEGKYSGGLNVLADSGDISIASGSINTNGEFAGGIFAVAQTGSITIDSGEISTHDHYSRGIVAIAAQDLTITSGDVSTYSPTFEADGIVALARGSASISAGNINVHGDHSYGVMAVANDGVSVSAGDITVESASGGYASAGVVAVTYGGPATVSVESVNSTGFGVYSRSEDGASSVTARGIETSGDYAFGVFSGAFGYAGDARVTVDDLTTRGYAAFGVYAESEGGDAIVDFGSVTTEGQFSFAVQSVSRLFGDVVVSGDAITTHGDYATGVSARSYGGSVHVDVGSVDTSGSFSAGIFTYAAHQRNPYSGDNYFGDIDINVDQLKTTGFGSYGVFALANAGDIDITAADVATEGYHATAIKAVASTVGDFLNPYFHPGDVRIAAGQVSTDGAFATGISGYSTAGAVSIDADNVVTHGDFATGIEGLAGYSINDGKLYAGDVNIRAGSVTTEGAYADGIVAVTRASNVTITAGPVTASGQGAIGVFGKTYAAGDVTLNLSGDVTAAQGAAVVIDTAGAATVNIRAANGLADAPPPVIFGGVGAIFVSSHDGAVVNNDGVIASQSGLAVQGSGGRVTVNNRGAMQGFVIFGAADDRVNNGGHWQAQGDSSFGGGWDSVVNSGLISVGGPSAAPMTIAWKGLESVTNSGDISLQNGHAGDVLDLGAAAFDGVGTSTVRIDVDYTDANTLFADKLIVGDASGSTQLLVSGRGTLGSVVVVDARSATSADNFVLPGGRLDTGLVDLTLAFDPANADWSLVGLPDIEAFELLKLSGAAQDLWKRGGDTWTNRMLEGRDQAAAGDGGEVWGQYDGGGQGQGGVQGFDALGSHFSEDLSTKTRWTGGQVGADRRHGPWVWGGTAGYHSQNTTFTIDGNRLHLDGVNAGAYAGWNSGGFFANGLVDYLRFRAEADLVSAALDRSVHGHAWGARGEAGYRFGAGSVFFEPSVSLAWSSASLGDLAGANAVASYDRAGSLTATIGGRFGAAASPGPLTMRPYLGLYAVTEAKGDNRFGFSTGPVGFTASDSRSGTYGKAVAGVSIGDDHGLQLFMSGEADVGRVTGLNGQAGLRWRW